MTRNERSLPGRDERGQVGIGTLIVFIAMVLVAAIAAGVLINTAGFLQSTSEATGQESTSQVVNRLEITGATGDDISSGTISKVHLTVTQAPGADNINLENVTVQWVGPSGTYNIVHTDATQSADGPFTTSAIKDDDGSAPVVNDPDDRVEMNFDIGSGDDFGEDLAGGETVRLDISTQSGGSITTTLVVPESVDGKTAVAL